MKRAERKDLMKRQELFPEILKIRIGNFTDARLRAAKMNVSLFLSLFKEEQQNVAYSQLATFIFLIYLLAILFSLSRKFFKLLLFH